MNKQQTKGKPVLSKVEEGRNSLTNMENFAWCDCRCEFYNFNGELWV